MRVAVVATAICLSIVGLAEAQSAKAAIKMSTNIPTQALGPALKAFAQERDLQHPVDDDGGLAEIEVTEDVRCDENVVEHQQGDREDARHLDDGSRRGKNCGAPA